MVIIVSVFSTQILVFLKIVSNAPVWNSAKSMYNKTKIYSLKLFRNEISNKYISLCR